MPFQRGLSAWEPAAAPQQLQQQADGAAAAVEATDTGRSEAAEMHELLQRLPGLQRSLRDAAQEGTGLLDLEAMKMTDYDVMRLPRKPEPELNEWDLRAKMEKRRRHEQETAGRREGRRGGVARLGGSLCIAVALHACLWASYATSAAAAL